MKFKVGDEVDWLGAIGVIIDILEHSLVVNFDGHVYFFELDGRFLPEQKPSLKRLEEHYA